MDGWIKLHRKILNNPIFQNAELLRLFLYCLLRAGYQEKEIIFNEGIKELETGEFITGAGILSSELKQNQNTTWKRLKLLEKLGYLSIKSTNKFSVIKVSKFDIYQIENLEDYKPDTNEVQTKYKPDTTNKKDKKDKNINNLSKDKLCQTASDEAPQETFCKKTPYEEIASLFNSVCVSLPAIKTLSEKRKEKIRCRWKEKADLKFWEEIFKKIESSDFLTGRSGAWHNCGFDWVITNNTNYLKVLEGNYENKQKQEANYEDESSPECLGRLSRNSI